MMSDGYLTTTASAKLAVVLAQMRRHGVDRVAVVDADRIVGMLATSDVLRLDEVLEVVQDRQDEAGAE